MFNAIHAETKKSVNSLNIEDDSSFNFPKKEKWYADPNEIESYDEDKVENIKEIEVKYRKKSKKIINKFGTEYFISPHFWIPNKKKLGINTVTESKEHKLAKNFIYNKLLNNDLEFVYSKVYSPEKYKNKFLANGKIDKSRIGIEVVCKNNKKQIADILLPFKKRDKLFGEGIVIEIQFTKQGKKQRKKRTINWCLKGYSISWYKINDFNEVSENFIELKDDVMKVEPMYKILKKYKEELVKDLRFSTQNLSRKIDEKMEEFKKMKKEAIKPALNGKCPKCGKGILRKIKGKKGDFYGCSQYPLCNFTVSI
ncbi:MAG: topoisomerase DNA-binding C4 zinc finger domain-containing protein [Bacteroidales bacterium]